MKKVCCFSVPKRRGHAKPCRATQGSMRVSQGNMGSFVGISPRMNGGGVVGTVRIG